MDVLLQNLEIARHRVQRCPKLVTEPGGDAVPDTQWSIQTPTGEIIKESVGALPTHILAPGTYAAFAKKAGKTYRRDFLIRPGDIVQVEVIAQ